MTTSTEKLQKKRKVYSLINHKPVAKFFYQGSHSHPVRRTVLIIQETDTKIVGYEFRCGNTVRTVSQALQENAVKTYRKDKIAKWGDYSRLRMTSKTFLKDPEDTTLERLPILSMFHDGA